MIRIAHVRDVERRPRRAPGHAVVDWSEASCAAGHVTEWWNGAGGPAGLPGGLIPQSARIAAVARTWAALTADGSPRIGHMDALSHLDAAAGVRLDPRVVKAAFAVVSQERLSAAEPAPEPRLHHLHVPARAAPHARQRVAAAPRTVEGCKVEYLPPQRAAPQGARRPAPPPPRAAGRGAARRRRARRVVRARARRGARPAQRRAARLARARRRARAALLPVLRAHVQADLLPADVVADELRAGDVRARGRLDRPRQRRRRARPRRLGAAQGRDAGGGDRAPHGRVLRDQERGELRRGGGRRRRDVARRRPAPVGAAHAAARRAGRARARRAPADRDAARQASRRRSTAGAAGSPSRRRRWATACARRGGSCARRDWRVYRRLDRLLGVRQRGHLGVLPRVRRVAADHARADGLPDRPARRPAPDPGRHRRDRRRADRRA